MRDRAAQSRGRLIFLLIALVVVLSAFFFLTPGFFDAEKDVVQERQGEESLSTTQSFVGRKNIYDRNLRALAVSFRLTSVYARPLEIKEPLLIAHKLAAILDLDEKAILAAIKAERSFVWIGRHISPEKAEAIAALNLKGIHMIYEVQRFYPNHTVAAHVVGFMKDEQGLAGIESYYDPVLRGAGFKDSGTSANVLPSGIDADERGAHLVLTLDLDVQKELEMQLARLVKKTKAKTAMAAIMNVEDGAVLGLANFPTYDLNLFWDYGAAERKNRVVSDRVFPGEINRLFCMAAALDQGQVLESLTKATIAAGDREAAPQVDPLTGWREVSEGSYVSPEVYMLDKQTSDKVAWDEFFKKVGFGEKSGVDLPEKSITGTASDVGDSGDIAYDLTDKTPSTTALSLLSAFSRLVNGGKNLSPHLLEAVWDQRKRMKVGHGDKGHDLSVRAEVSHAFLTLLKQNKSNTRGALYFESALAEDPVTTVSETGYSLNAKGSEALPEFHAVLLGMTPQQFPEVALIIVVDGAHLDLDEPSPLREIANGLAGRVLKIIQRKVPETQGPKMANENEYYKKWLALQPKVDDRLVLRQGLHKEKMPDVRGNSLRKALQTLQEYGLKVKVNGSGRVVAQKPVPGARLQGVEECRLELRFEH